MKQPAIPSKRSVGRPRAFDREQALGIALGLFWRHGFDGTSIPQLTAAMGISPPSLYAAFGSKDALYREAVKLYLTRYSGFMKSLFDDKLSARDAVEHALLAAAKQFSEPGHAPGCMISSAELQTSPGNQKLADEIASFRLAAQQVVYTRLEAARNSGELPRITDTASLAAFYAMISQGMSVQARDGAKAAVLKRLVKLAMQAWPHSN
ncbi:MAG TPA: TetR/AcrR family transcriptional regulator [Gallionellaceae bacterium]|nr:TetR/AcrR family transcriptional regulator [Gallionellaceae bacterium]